MAVRAAAESSASRRLPVGAEIMAGGVHFRVWAPARREVQVVVEGVGATPLDREVGGYFSGLVPGLAAGARYRYRLDGTLLRPDPASRFQPDGPHGPSEVVDPSRFRWRDEGWPGLAPPGQVLYELHVGTFTREGTWAAATRELAALARLGVTALEVMPVAEFSGRFGWGYDGVDLFAPYHVYGISDEMRAFVDHAHALGLGVLLDVVYNHLGPDGNYLTDFAPAYFTDRYTTEWGPPIHFDGDDSGPVREFFLANARYWIDEFHLDGLRLDATQAIFDRSEEHIVAAVAQAVRAAAAGRGTLVVAENEPQHARLVRPRQAGGYGLDAIWNDDFHHSAMAALTGHNEAYYSDTRGTPQELVSCAKHGFLYQGQLYPWQGKRRGTPATGLPPHAFVCYLQNHDQVANSARGLRAHRLGSPGRHRALTALLLLGPWTPMLFEGQEMDASAPFLYFADHRGELARTVRRGRARFLHQFPSIAAPDMRDRLDDPGDPATFERCKLDPGERERHHDAVALHRDLLDIRRSDPVVALQGERGVDGAILGPEAFCLRFYGGEGDDRLLLVNLGLDLHLSSAPEPLLAPPEARRWATAWSSEDPRYGGSGTPPVEDEKGVHLTGHAAALLAARAAEEDHGR
jgi:maltooligosyltrehalose trehalohydrolase